MKKLKLLKRAAAAGVVFAVIVGVLSGGYAYAKDRRFNMSYMYFGDTQAFIRNVDKTKGSLDTVSPSYFDLDAAGNLVLNRAASRDFVEEMKQRGIRVVPFLSNHWDRAKGRAALANREALARQVADAVMEYDFDGVNVDIENLTEVDCQAYVDLVRLIREELPKSKEVSVAVAANPRGLSTGWQGSYDYKALARYSDYLMIMAYDEHSEGSVQGPVASISFVEESIKYALQQVPADKIVLGIPFFGRYWKVGRGYGGYGLHLSKVQELVGTFNGRVEFDQHTASPKATISVTSRSGPVRVTNGVLDPGTYIIWFENEQSIQHKLRLVQKYRLKGAGSWSLGQETGQTWDYFDDWLNGNWFVDTYGHWAQHEIAEMEETGWMQGVSSTHFAPDNPLTRAQAAAIMVRALGLEEGRKPGNFSDVTSRHWARKEIGIAAEHGIMQGKGNGRFGPEDPLTREEMAVVLERIMDIDEEDLDGEEISFRDVDRNRWSYPAIHAMSRHGIFMGYDDGTFKPQYKITRAQMAALMSRIKPHIEKD